MGDYSNTAIRYVTVAGGSISDRAHEKWNSMTPAERFSVMDKVKPFKSITLRHRACINYIAENML